LELTLRPKRIAATHVYVVQPGDTLWALAARYLGNPLRYQELFALNRGISQIDGFTLVDPNLIYPGMKLLLPADATGLPPPAP
jgi:nucleoid-associated protein YgaU